MLCNQEMSLSSVSMSKFITHISHKTTEESPIIKLSPDEALAPLGKSLSLSFDLSERFCVGWYDIAKRTSHPCPDNAQTEKKFDTCIACQRRTGFNPAFYHATSVSPQQEALNAEPHQLYLAYMGKDYIKVGISRGKRGLQRLLEQGARAGLVLETFPTALIARQYEARAARLNGIHETTPTRTKLTLLNEPFEPEVAHQHLLTAKERLEAEMSVSFSGSNPELFDDFYGLSAGSQGEITPMREAKISGAVEALVGDILITQYDGRRLALPLKQYTGYPLEILDDIAPLDLEPQQMQLF